MRPQPRRFGAPLHSPCDRSSSTARRLARTSAGLMKAAATRRRLCSIRKADQLSSRNNAGPLAATRHRSDSGNSRRRATNNIRQAAPALPQRQQRRSWRQLLRQRTRPVRGPARRRQCRRLCHPRSHPPRDLAPAVGVVAAAPSLLVGVAAVPSPLAGVAAFPLAPAARA